MSGAAARVLKKCQTRGPGGVVTGRPARGGHDCCLLDAIRLSGASTGCRADRLPQFALKVHVGWLLVFPAESICVACAVYVLPALSWPTAVVMLQEPALDNGEVNVVNNVPPIPVPMNILTLMMVPLSFVVPATVFRPAPPVDELMPSWARSCRS